MTVEMTRDEAELLIAMLTFAEGAAPVLQPELVEAMQQLRPWRSALVAAYLRSAEPTDAQMDAERTAWARADQGFMGGPK